MAVEYSDALLAASSTDLVQYVSNLELKLACQQATLAAELFEYQKRLRVNGAGQSKDCNFFSYINEGVQYYDDSVACAMPIAKTDAVRIYGRKMHAKLSTIGMYSAGRKRDIIETNLGIIAGDVGGAYAMAYRSEKSLYDETYFDIKQAKLATIDKSQIYVATKEMSKVADRMVELTQYALDIRESTISGNIETAARIVDSIPVGLKDKIENFFKPKGSESSAAPSLGKIDTAARTVLGKQQATASGPNTTSGIVYNNTGSPTTQQLPSGTPTPAGTPIYPDGGL